MYVKNQVKTSMRFFDVGIWKVRSPLFHYTRSKENKRYEISWNTHRSSRPGELSKVIHETKEKDTK